MRVLVLSLSVTSPTPTKTTTTVLVNEEGTPLCEVCLKDVAFCQEQDPSNPSVSAYVCIDCWMERVPRNNTNPWKKVSRKKKDNTDFSTDNDSFSFDSDQTSTDTTLRTEPRQTTQAKSRKGCESPSLRQPVLQGTSKPLSQRGSKPRPSSTSCPSSTTKPPHQQQLQQKHQRQLFSPAATPAPMTPTTTMPEYGPKMLTHCVWCGIPVTRDTTYYPGVGPLCRAHALTAKEMAGLPPTDFNDQPDWLQGATHALVRTTSIPMTLQTETTTSATRLQPLQGQGPHMPSDTMTSGPVLPQQWQQQPQHNPPTSQPALTFNNNTQPQPIKPQASTGSENVTDFDKELEKLQTLDIHTLQDQQQRLTNDNLNFRRALQIRWQNQQHQLQRLEHNMTFYKDIALKEIRELAKDLQATKLNYPLQHYNLSQYERILVHKLPLLDKWTDQALATAMVDGLGRSVQEQLRLRPDYTQLTTSPSRLHQSLLQLAASSKQLERDKILNQLAKYTITPDTIATDFAYYRRLRQAANDYNIYYTASDWVRFLLSRRPEIISKVYEDAAPEEPTERTVWKRLFILHKTAMVKKSIHKSKTPSAMLADPMVDDDLPHVDTSDIQSIHTTEDDTAMYGQPVTYRQARPGTQPTSNRTDKTQSRYKHDKRRKATRQQQKATKHTTTTAHLADQLSTDDGDTASATTSEDDESGQTGTTTDASDQEAAYWAAKQDNNDKKDNKKDRPCFNCGETGHWISDCPKPIKKKTKDKSKGDWNKNKKDKQREDKSKDRDKRPDRFKTRHHS